jgi:hypothetical protein
MSEIARHQLLITLVHGTWPRGLFPKLVRFKQWVRGLMRRELLDMPPFWFEEASPFLARLSTELGDIPHTITPLLWTGKNSVYERKKVAHDLADRLSAEHAEYPQATQLLIAHSHGGNIALRALHHLQTSDASQSCSAETPTPFVVTLATPFIEVHQADFGQIPATIRMVATLLASLLVFFLIMFLGSFFHSLPDEPMAAVASAVTMTGWGLWWWRVSQRAGVRQSQLDALKDATRIGVIVPGQRLLVIRAIDDEASLTMALGTILNYTTARSVVFLFLRLSALPALALIILKAFDFPHWTLIAAVAAYFALLIMLLGLLMVSRLVHGSELARSPLECQINTQSTPDADGLSKIVTLVRRTYLKSRRHGVYDHEDCPKTISDWVRSQLCGLPAR